MAEEQGDYKEDIHKKGSIGLGVILKQDFKKNPHLEQFQISATVVKL